MKKQINIFMLTLLIISQTILGPIGASVASAESFPQSTSNDVGNEENKRNSAEADTEKVEVPEQDLVKPEEPKEPVKPKPENEGSNDSEEQLDKPSVESDEKPDEKPVIKPETKPEAKPESKPEARPESPSTDETQPDATDDEEIIDEEKDAEDVDADEEPAEEDESDEEEKETVPAGELPSSVITDAELRINDTLISGTGPFTVKNGDNATLKFNLELAAGHTYGPGSTLKYTLPEVFNGITFPEGTNFGELGVITQSGREITITFNDSIIDEEGIGAALENAKFTISVTLNSVDNETNQKVELPGKQIIELNFAPVNGNSITKENGVAKPSATNSEFIEWEVKVNTDLKATGTVAFKDTLTTNTDSGHIYDQNSVVITELSMKADGSYTETATGLTPNFNGTNKVMSINLDGTKAYKITYKTIPEDPGNNESVQYHNKAEYGDAKSETKSATVSYGAPLNKSVSEKPNGSNLATEWKIDYNFNNRTISEKDAVLKDTWTTSGGAGTGKQVLSDFNVYEADGTTPVAAGVYTKTDNGDGQGFTLQFNQEVTKPYVIKYKTTPSDIFAAQDFKVTNTVKREDIVIGDKTASQSYTKKSFVLNKTANSIDYEAKTIKWSITANQANYSLNANSVFEDKFTNSNMTLQQDTLKVTVGGVTLAKGADYTVTDISKDGFKVTLLKAVDKEINISYTTDYDIKDVGTNTRAFKNDIVLKNSGLPKDPSDSAEASIKLEQKTNGKKEGKYNYATQEFEWEVELNFNYNEFTNAIFEDVLPDTQKVTDIKVYSGTLNSAGNFQQGAALTVTNTASEPNKIVLDLGDITTPHKVVYKSKDKDGVYPVTKDNISIKNQAKLTQDGNPDLTSSWTKTVTVNYTDKLINKTGVQVDGTAGIKWNFEFNYAQSNLQNVVITDTVGASEGSPDQIIDRDSFKVYEVALTGSESIPSIGKTELKSGYTLNVDNKKGKFTLTLPDGNKAYYVEYETTYFGPSGANSNATNNVEVNYISTEGLHASDSSPIKNFTYGNSGSTTKVPFVAIKIDGVTGLPMADVTFTLFSEYRPGKALTSAKTDANGVFDLGMNLTEGKYTLKETTVDGYDNPGDIHFTLHRDSVQKSGTYAGKQIVNIENFPTGYEDKICKDFVLTAKDVDGMPVSNKELILTNKATGQVSKVTTGTDGLVKIPSSGNNKINAGTYTVTTADNSVLKDVKINYTEDCEASVQPAPSCDSFTITVQDKDLSARPNVSVTLKHTTDDSVDVITVKTDDEGKIKLPSKTTTAGIYTVYEGKILLGQVNVTYKSDCIASVGEGAQCENFTLTVIDADGEQLVNNITIKKADSVDQAIVGTATAENTLSFEALAPGKYDVYEDSEKLGSFTVNEECEFVFTQELKCEEFTIIIEDIKGEIRPNLTVKLTHKIDGTVIKTSTDAAGKIKLPSTTTAGIYTVYEGNIFLGEVNVTYKDVSCKDVVGELSKCETFTLTVRDADGELREAGIDIKITKKDETAEFKTIKTTTGGIVSIPNLPPGEYDAYENGEKIGSFSSNDKCATELELILTCTNFTITVEDQDGAIRPNVTVSMKYKDDSTVKTMTAKSNKDGKIVLSIDTKPGIYEVYEGKQYVGDVKVTYLTDCEASVGKMATCETFTLAVKDVDGKLFPTGTEITIKERGSTDTFKKGIVDADGNVSLPNLPRGNYVAFVGEEELGNFKSDADCKASVQPLPTCTDITITIKDQDGKPRAGIMISVKKEKKNVPFYTAKTNAQGEMKVPLTDIQNAGGPGQYFVYEGDLFIKEIEVSYKDCIAEVSAAAPVCEDFTLTVQYRSGEVRPDVEVIVKSITGETIINAKTDRNGQIKIDNKKMKQGTYQVFEKSSLINSFKVTDTCSATVKPKPLPPQPEVCTDFTIAVFEEGNPARPDIEVVLKDGDKEVAKGITNINGDVKISKSVLPNGDYEAYVDGKKVGTVKVTDTCHETITIPTNPTCENFTLTIMENNNPIIKGKEVILKSGDKEITKGKTDVTGKVVFPINVKHGKYDVIVDGKKVGTVTVTETCEGTISYAPVCDDFTATVTKDGKPVKDKEIVLKKDDKEVAKGKTDKDGRVTFPGKMPTGDYDVYVEGEKSGNVTVGNPCEAGTIVLAPTCEYFTLTVYEDGKPVGPGKQITLKQGETVKAVGTTNAQGKIVFDIAKLAKDEYDAYHQEVKIGKVNVTNTCEETLTLTHAPVCEEFTVTVTEDGKSVGAGKEVILKDGDKEVAKGITNTDGKVIFPGKLPNGAYDTSVDGKATGPITITNSCEAVLNVEGSSGGGNPVDPNEPGKPGEPVDPNEPGKPGEPVDPNEPGKPGEPADPNEPGKPGEPADPNEPGKPGEPVDPNEPGKPGEPVDPNEPDKPGEPADPNEPGKPGEPVDPNKPGKPGEPVDPNEPGKPSTPLTPSTPNIPAGSIGAAGSNTNGSNGTISSISGSKNPNTSTGSNLPQTGEIYPIIPITLGILLIAGGVWVLRRKKHA
ncbi:hypothetical protein CSV78_12320 [Sporosarcina sp. P16a]|uniref:collagen binding domain-containing protein n=1 Tax=unclassified Sporosarcina TaxID=2647733 RepID=UPI000C16A282|nr:MULTISPECIES: collagen binding domain-containing protein [unclassified Sporosarcina]PIC66447.1 hypothetical protein CSV78_12320 [Sporosarcina sp. P16a]PIC92085.1 hypothetical protein CSV70_12570 [Sporosarcina sp. P25]